MLRRKEMLWSKEIKLMNLCTLFLFLSNIVQIYSHR